MEKTIKLNESLKASLSTFKKDFWYFVGIAVVVILLQGIGSNPNRDDSVNGKGILGLLITAWLTPGYLKIMLNYLTGKKMPFVELFTQIRYFWRMLGAYLLIGLIIGLGLVLLVVPGIYFGIRLQFTPILIVDKDMGLIEAMKESYRMTERRVWSIFVFDLVCLGIIILGAILLFIGIFVATPIVWLAQINLYKSLK